MAVYKVPQDVEAEDKLLGPFSFKQFIFLIIAVMALGLAYGLSRVLLPLAIIPLPVAIFFIVLALPLRKDQPMEVYLAAIISFILKPKIRLWRPDGIESLIEVIAPKVEENLSKNYSQEEVHRRLSYLANIVDSRGWSVRGVNEPESSMQTELYNEARSIDDPLDDSGVRSQNINNLLDQQDNQRRQEIIERMRQVHTNAAEAPAGQPAGPNINMQTTQYGQPTPGQPLVSPAYTPMSTVKSDNPNEDIKLVINPYPTMQQSVLTPLSERPSSPPAQPFQENIEQPALTSSEKEVPPAIIDLANNKDRTIDSLQREADQIMKKEQQKDEEVVISLR